MRLVWEGAVFAGSTLGVAAGGAFTIALAAACVSDLRTRRIPNVLTGLLAAAGVAYTLAAGRGLAHGIGGILVGFVIWVPFWLLGWLGAGDVKLVAAAGAWLGPWATVEASVVAALVGAVLSIGWMLRAGRMRAVANRVVLATASPRLLGGAVVSSGDRRRLAPYALALVVGLLVAGWCPMTAF